MKVLFIPSWYPSHEQPTAGIFVAQQVEAVRVGCDVAVLYVREATDDVGPTLSRESGLPVARAELAMGRPAISLLGRMRAVTKNLRNKLVRYPKVGVDAFEQLRATWGTPDIIHVQALWPAAIIAHRLKRLYGIPYVVTEHSEEYMPQSSRRLVRTPGIVSVILRPLALGASRTIAVSKVLAERLTALGLARSPIVIPNVVPVSEPAPVSSAIPHAIAHVSIMGPAKALDTLLQAINILRGRRSDFVLRLVGDGECRADLETLASQLGLGGVVEFTGLRSAEEVREILAESAFAVVSSTHETFSVSGAEALMCGRPVVSTRCGGPEEYVTSEVGRLVDSGSVEALADGLDWMLDHFAEFDPRTLHEYARARFAPDVVAARITEVYREALDG